MLFVMPHFDFFEGFSVSLLQNQGFFRSFLKFLTFWRNFLSLISFIGFLMSTSKDKKPVSALEVVPMMSNITEDKLIDPNYLD